VSYSLPFPDLTNTGCNDANKLKRNFSELIDDINDVNGLFLHGVGIGYIPKAKTTRTWQDSLIYDNGINLGIGTILPAEKLTLLDSNLLIESDANSATANSLIFDKHRGAAAGQAGDVLGNLIFKGRNDAATPEVIEYTRITGSIVDASDGHEKGKFQFTSYSNEFLYSGVDHGITDYLPTDAYGKIGISDSDYGGLQIIGASNNGCSGNPYGIELLGILGVADPGDSYPALLFTGAKKNGTDIQALAAAETAFKFRNYQTELLTILGNGNIFTEDWTDISNSCTPSGWSSVSDKVIWAKTIGKEVVLAFIIGGTSDHAWASFSLPYSCHNLGFDSNWTAFTAPCRWTDNGSEGSTPGMIQIIGANVNCFKIYNDVISFTSSGSKWVSGIIRFTKA